MNSTIITLDQIKQLIAKADPTALVSAIEQGFVAYSEGRAEVPPVGILQFHSPPGDTHIKYGYITGDASYVVKVASGFYDNPSRGLPATNGVMLIFSQTTGELTSVLLDEGYLTDIRTAIAGAVVAKYLAPQTVKAIGIVGTGTQARLQLQYLLSVVDCRQVYVYGRSETSLQAYLNATSDLGCTITPTMNIADLTDVCNYIVTTTPSTQPLLWAADVRAGTHITAMGADAPGKQELDPALVARADVLVVDSLSQCIDHGEVADALKQKRIDQTHLTELGTFIKNNRRRDNDQQITIADLTGVAVQDIKIATYVYDLAVEGL